jgi:hypothetical protein
VTLGGGASGRRPVDANVERVEAEHVGLVNAAQAKEIPGVDLSALSPTQRTAALKRLNADRCTCGCSLTLAECRINDSSCPVSLPLARKVGEPLGTRNLIRQLKFRRSQVNYSEPRPRLAGGQPKIAEL